MPASGCRCDIPSIIKEPREAGEFGMTVRPVSIVSNDQRHSDLLLFASSLTDTDSLAIMIDKVRANNLGIVTKSVSGVSCPVKHSRITLSPKPPLKRLVSNIVATDSSVADLVRELLVFME